MFQDVNFEEKEKNLLDDWNKISNDVLGIIASYHRFDELYGLMQLSKRMKNIIYERYPPTTIDLDSCQAGLFYMSISKNVKLDYSGNGIKNHLTYLRHLTNINSLSTFSKISDNDMKCLTNLTKLNLLDDHKITNYGISHLSKLKKLNLAHNYTITEEILISFPELINLELNYNQNITNNGIKNLIQLKILDLSNNHTITGKGLINLVNLTDLDISKNNTICDDDIKHLMNLERLNLHENTIISNDGIKIFTKLKYLDIRDNSQITIDGIKEMKYLEEISLFHSQIKIDDIGVEQMPNLKRIVFQHGYFRKYKEKLKARGITLIEYRRKKF